MIVVNIISPVKSMNAVNKPNLRAISRAITV